MATGNAIQSASSSGGGGAPSGPAGGDLSGTYPNPTVAQSNAGTFTVQNTFVVNGTSNLASTNMFGALNMETHKITSLTNGSAASDAAAFGQIPLADATASHISPDGTQAAGANGTWADSGHVHPAVVGATPADHGLLTMNYDPLCASSTQIMTAGTLYLMRLNIYKAITFTNVMVGVTSSGVGTPGTGTFVGLYNSSGTLLSGSADVASSLNSSGTKTLPLTTPQALSAGTFVWVALLANMATTQPTLGRTAASAVMGNLNLAAASSRMTVNGTSLTALPGSVTPASNTNTGAQSFWVGGS